MKVVEDIVFQLIITIVNKGDATEVITAARKGGAEGGTIMHGRGAGIHETAKFFGLVIEPEKEVILTLVDSRITDAVLDSISDAVELDKAGHGIAFVLDVPKVTGIRHLTK